MTQTAVVLGFVGLILLISGLAVKLQMRACASCSAPVTARVIY